MAVHTCKTCGVSFKRRGKYRKFCSRNCIRFTPEQRQYQIEIARKTWTGRKHSAASIEKMSRVAKERGVGLWLKDPEMKKRIYTKEWREKIKIAQNRPEFVLQKIARQTGQKRSAETREKMAAIRRGALSHFWEGGATELTDQIRNHIKYKLWRESVQKRDHWTCVLCKERNSGGKRMRIEIDHIIPLSFIKKKYSINSIEDALGCEQLWDMNNGRTLCSACHRKTPTYSIKSKKYVGVV